MEFEFKVYLEGNIKIEADTREEAIEILQNGDININDLTDIEIGDFE